jgi:hypothetical protein
MFQTKVVEKTNTCVMFSNVFFFPEYHGIYEIMWKNMVETDTPAAYVLYMLGN